jgi:glucose-fructose oxidoreductase
MSRARRPRPSQPLRLAVAGLGHFAQVAVLPGARQLGSVELAALVSGSATKLRELGDRYGVERRVDYDGLDALIASGEVDALYVVTPPDLHEPLVLAAARHGVHVLCEKPMAPSAAACERMIAACREAGVALMIGYRLHFEPANLAAIEILRAGTIGTPRAFASTFTMQVRADNIRVEDRPGAGPLFDLGVYCVNAIRYLFRSEPVDVTAHAVARDDDPRFRHVPETVSATLRLRGGAVAAFTCGFGAADRAHYEVVGTEGVLLVENAYEYVGEIEVKVIKDGEGRTRRYGKRDQIAAEIEYFARCLADGVAPEPSGAEGLADVRVIEAIVEAAATGRRVVVAPPAALARPEPDQARRVPPHGKPELVGVAPGSR